MIGARAPAPGAARLACIFVAALLVSAPCFALAQRPDRCAPLDTSAGWYRKQHAWTNDTRHDWSNDSLRVALIRAAGLDTQTSGTALLGYEVAGTAPNETALADSTALVYLRGLTRSRGTPWPTRSVVGAAGVRAVWVLVGRDSALSRVALHRMMEAGPDESLPAAVAMLEDRLRVLNGRKQLYGTQVARKADGTLEPLPIEDPKHVDLRRDAAGLAPLAQMTCALRPGRGR